MASKALGHLARAGGALTVEFVEFQIKQSLEWLQVERNERRHLAAVLVLRELAQNTPTLFNVYVDDFLEHIWSDQGACRHARCSRSPARRGSAGRGVAWRHTARQSTVASRALISSHVTPPSRPC